MARKANETSNTGKEETAIAVVEESETALAPQASSGLGEGFENFDPGDLIMPRLKVQQPNSKGDTALTGKLVDSLLGTAVTSVDVVFLSARKGRVWWAPFGTTDNDEPLCKSRDGLVPDPSIEDPPCSKCAEFNGRRLSPVCIKAKWGDDGAKPACGETITMIGVNASDGAPFLFAVHGSGIKPTRAFLSGVALRRKALRDARVTLTLDMVQGKQGKFYVPRYADLTWNEPGAYDEPYKMFAGYDPEATYDAEKKGVEHEGGPDNPDNYDTSFNHGANEPTDAEIAASKKISTEDIPF